VPSFRIPLIWFLCFLLAPTFHRHMLPLVSLMFGTSVAWISSSIIYFWRDLDLHGMLCFLRKFFPLGIKTAQYFKSCVISSTFISSLSRLLWKINWNMHSQFVESRQVMALVNGSVCVLLTCIPWQNCSVVLQYLVWHTLQVTQNT